MNKLPDFDYMTVNELKEYLLTNFGQKSKSKIKKSDLISDIKSRHVTDINKLTIKDLKSYAANRLLLPIPRNLKTKGQILEYINAQGDVDTDSEADTYSSDSSDSEESAESDFESSAPVNVLDIQEATNIGSPPALRSPKRLTPNIPSLPKSEVRSVSLSPISLKTISPIDLDLLYGSPVRKWETDLETLKNVRADNPTVRRTLQVPHDAHEFHNKSSSTRRVEDDLLNEIHSKSETPKSRTTVKRKTSKKVKTPQNITPQMQEDTSEDAEELEPEVEVLTPVKPKKQVKFKKPSGSLPPLLTKVKSVTTTIPSNRSTTPYIVPSLEEIENPTVNLRSTERTKQTIHKVWLPKFNTKVKMDLTNNTRPTITNNNLIETVNSINVVTAKDILKDIDVSKFTDKRISKANKGYELKEIQDFAERLGITTGSKSKTVLIRELKNRMVQEGLLAATPLLMKK